MEDGIMSAPAPYSAPDAYYSPNAGRMNGIEVIKGSSSTKYGPHSVGGVINYLSTPIPNEETFYYKQLFGNYGEARSHAYYGNSYDLEASTLSFLLEYYDRQNDGFRDIQHASGDTGINHQQEPMLKVRFEPKTSQYQFFEFKLAHTEMSAPLSYYGIEDEEFEDNPYDRYWGTQWDQFDARSTRTYLKHFIELDEDSSLETSVYYNKIHRNWEKIKTVTDDGSGDSKLDIIKGIGTGNDEIALKNNNRDYDAYGIQSEYKQSITLGGLQNNFTFGARYHVDTYEDDSWYNRYSVTGRTVNGITSDKATADPGDYRKAESVSLYLVDQIEVTDKLTITPGVRYETIQYKLDQRGDTGRPKYQNQHDFWAPGVGFAYDFNENYQLFGGIHKGISTPGVEANTVDGTRHEESINYELGLRYRKEAAAAEAVLFFNDISDYYDGESQASGTVDGQTVGDVETYGLELSAAYDLGVANGWDFSNPWYAAYTYTHTEIVHLNDGVAAEDGFFNGAEEGNEMPYIAKNQFALGTGLHFGKVGFDLSTNFVGGMYSGADNDRRIGENFLVDLSGYYDVNDNFRLVANIHNLFDEEYEASHHPNYDRAGKPLTFTAGFEVKF